jgi:hypothetical protein
MVGFECSFLQQTFDQNNVHHHEHRAKSMPMMELLLIMNDPLSNYFNATHEHDGDK